MPRWVALAGYLKACGRDPAGFGIAGRVQIDASDLEGSARKAVAWKALDVTHLSAITMNAAPGDPRLPRGTRQRDLNHALENPISVTAMAQMIVFWRDHFRSLSGSSYRCDSRRA
jgi:hypothetical protein